MSETGPRLPARSGRGRQAEAARNDAGVLEAARLVFAVEGPDAPVSRVAEVAGVGMGTLYRRFPSKEALLQYVSRASLDEQVTQARAAGEEADAWAALVRFVTWAVEVRAGVLGTVAGRFEPDTDTVAAARSAHRGVDALVRRAQAAGDLRPDVTSTDIHQLVTMISRRPVEEDHQYRRLLAISLGGLRVAVPALPAPAPTWREYAGRWRT